MKKLLLIISLIYGCTAANRLSELKFDCNNKNEVVRISDSVMIKTGYNLTFLDRVINENQDSITIEYMLKKKPSCCYGAEIVISKKDCKISMLRYQ